MLGSTIQTFAQAGEKWSKSSGGLAADFPSKFITTSGIFKSPYKVLGIYTVINPVTQAKQLLYLISILFKVMTLRLLIIMVCKKDHKLYRQA